MSSPYDAAIDDLHGPNLGCSNAIHVQSAGARRHGTLGRQADKDKPQRFMIHEHEFVLMKY